jgi:sugar/nucleoside kinase (ribokinase family)
MSPIQIVGLGLACLDILVRAKHLPTWDSGTRLNRIAVEGGGPVATGLVAAQRLGISTGFIGTYGSDRLGEIKRQTLVEEGVDVRKMIRRSNPENQVVLVVVNEETGERLFSGVEIASKDIQPSELDDTYLLQADYLHLDGSHNDAAHLAAQKMKEAGKKVLLDGSATKGPISPGMRNLVSRADFLICGTGFGPALTGENDIREAGKAMLSMGPEIVIQTEGHEGSYTTTANHQFHIPAFDVTVVDTTGAGDVFHGAFLVGHLKGWDLRSIVLFCTAVAGIKCTQLSGRRGIPTFGEAIGFLSQRGIQLYG